MAIQNGALDFSKKRAGQYDIILYGDKIGEIFQEKKNEWLIYTKENGTLSNSPYIERTLSDAKVMATLLANLY